MNIKRHSYPVLSCYHLGNSRGLSLELCARNEEDHMCISYCKSQCHIFLEMKMVQRGCTLQTVSRKTISTAYLRCVQMHTFAHIQLTLDFASLQVSDNLMGKKCFFSCIFSGGSLKRIFQFSWVAQSCPTLCDPVDSSTPGFPVYHQLPGLTQTHVH